MYEEVFTLSDGTTQTLEMRSTFPCKDGYVYAMVMGGALGAPRMKGLVEWMDEEGMAPDWMKTFDWYTDFDFSTITQETIDRVNEAITNFYMTHTKTELYEEALRRGQMIVPIGTQKSIFEDSQLAFREFWVKIEHPELGEALTYPGWPIKQSATPWRMQRRAPLIGEHNEEIYERELGLSKDELSIIKARGAI